MMKNKLLNQRQIVKHKIKFGTDGIRGNAEKFPFTKPALNYLGMAIAKWATEKYKKKPTVLIGYDTRISSSRIEEDLTEGLMNFPITVINSEVLPTPAICLLTKTEDFVDFGIVISASHNPYFDNGIKIIDSKNIKLNKDDEKIITDYFHEMQKEKTAISLDKNSNNIFMKDASKEYENKILSFFKNNFLNNIKIVIDCANGATYEIAPKLFKKLGAKVTTIAASPNGKNINENCGTLHLENLAQEVIQNKADIGFAFDGDGDRVLAVNKNGKIIDGDDILDLLSNHPEITNSNTIVGTIMSNFGFELHLEKNNKKLIRTSVGDKYVAAKLEEENMPLGGENSGHIIIKDYMNTGDGIFTALKILESIISNNNWKMKTFEKTPQILLNVPVYIKNDLSQEPYSKIINEHKNLLINGRIVVRYSGTENLLRVMVEDEKLDNATMLANSLAQKLQNTLKNQSII